MTELTEVSLRSGMESQRRRRSNFTDTELRILLREAFKRKDLTLGKVDGHVTVQMKHQAWEAIAEEVNLVSSVSRGKDEVRKKFVDMKSVVKKKAYKRRLEAERTGDEPRETDTFTAGELIMLSYLNESANLGLDIPESETTLPSLTALETRKILQIEDEVDLPNTRLNDDGCNVIYIVKDEIDSNHEDNAIDVNSDVENDDEEQSLLEMETEKDVTEQRENTTTNEFAQKEDLVAEQLSSNSADATFTYNMSPRVVKPHKNKRLKREIQYTNVGPRSRREAHHSSLEPSLEKDVQYSRIKPYMNKDIMYPETGTLREEDIPHSKFVPSIEKVLSQFLASKADDDSDTDLLFLRSLLPDIKKLSDRHKRTFKSNVISNLYSLLDKQDSECAKSACAENSEGNANSLESGTIVMSGDIDSSGMLVVNHVEKVNEIIKSAQKRKAS